MNKIYVTGDTHGEVMTRCRNIEESGITLDSSDYLIICGDCGLIWRNRQDVWTPYERAMYEDSPYKQPLQIQSLSNLPFTILYVDGNHSNHARLNTEYDVVNFYGGKAHKITDNIYHLMRGELYDICGKSIFTFGGARSHDIDNILDPKSDKFWGILDTLEHKGEFYRELGISWWPEEVASEEDYLHGYKTLAQNDWKCDYIITHEAPVSDIRTKFNYTDIHPMSYYFEEIKRCTTFRHWFYGHYHINSTTTSNCTCNYSRCMDITTMDDANWHTGFGDFTAETLHAIIQSAADESKDITHRVLR